MSIESVTVPLPADEPVWERVFTVSPLVLVATLEPDGTPDVAPKHMAGPLGWHGYYAFVCSPRHGTYANAIARDAFTVSYPTPDQVLEVGLAATARAPDDTKPALAALAIEPARAVDGVLVAGAMLQLECELDRVLDGFGENSLLIGRIVAASADERALRSVERDDADVVHDRPLLAYLSPGRFARIDASHAFPFPSDFRL
ncbi:MAG: flavin reductase [Thermoleophilia bacterium]|nr:flavin reductase [Thermoleophilia bacterium]MDH5332325.1 flavin reductase [Thermoleophilia bacterium]